MTRSRLELGERGKRGTHTHLGSLSLKPEKGVAEEKRESKGWRMWAAWGKVIPISSRYARK